MAFTYTTVNEQYGAGATGTVAFALDRQMSNGGDAAGLGASWVATLDGSGNISILLPSTLDPNNRTPSGTTDARMRVHERVNGGNRIYYVPIPTSGPVDLGSLARADESPVSSAFVPPAPAPGQCHFPASSHSSSTSATLANGLLRVVPWLVTQRLAIDRIGAEITTVGEAGSKLRLGIYADNGFVFPGALVLDAGQIAGDSATVQDLVCSLLLPPGLYWIGGAVQSAPTTQPTVRTVNNWCPPVPISIGSGLPSAGTAAVGNTHNAATGALPAIFQTSPVGAGAAPRLHVRVA